MIPGIAVRCHLVGYKLADIYGFVIPLCVELRSFHRSKTPGKDTPCDTMGYGVNFSGAVVPRSVPILRTLYRRMFQISEWHGTMISIKLFQIQQTAWLYGACGVNCSRFGIGERTGNTPLEAMVFEYAA